METVLMYGLFFIGLILIIKGGDWFVVKRCVYIEI